MKAIEIVVSAYSENSLSAVFRETQDFASAAPSEEVSVACGLRY